MHAFLREAVLMARGLHVQEARRVGVGGAHLKLTLLDGANVRGSLADS